MSITSDTLKIKELCDSLGLINVNVDSDEVVQICLGRLAPRFGVMNRCTTSGVHEVTLHEKNYGKKLDLSHVRIFASLGYVHILDEKRQKLDSKSEKCILVGYSQQRKGYKCFNPSTRKVLVTQDIVFDESTSWYSHDSGDRKIMMCLRPQYRPRFSAC